MTDRALPSDELGPLLDKWIISAGNCFVHRDPGTLVTYGSMRRDDLLQLMHATQAAERERCAKLCAIERLRRVVTAAQAVRAKAEDIGDFIVSCSLMTALALALDETAAHQDNPPTAASAPAAAP